MEVERAVGGGGLEVQVEIGEEEEAGEEEGRGEELVGGTNFAL